MRHMPALARTAHEFLNGSPLCSSAEHFAGDRPQFEPLVSLSSSLQPRGACPQRTRCCRSCSEATRALLWHCSRCKATRCTRCLRTTALHQLLAEQRRQLLLLGTPINFSAPAAAEDALGAWPATDERGRIFAWFLWTGDNPLPAYLQLCIESFEHAASERFCVRVVRPWHLQELFPACAGCVSPNGGQSHQSLGLHPAYTALSLVHRSDYLRCELMHRYGGLYCDCDTICCTSLGAPLEALHGHAAILPSLALLHEAGMNVGLFRRHSAITRSWRDTLLACLELRQAALWQFRSEFPLSVHEDCLDWNELLRDIVVPLVAALGPCGLWSLSGAAGALVDGGQHLRAHLWLPTREQGFDPLAVRDEIEGDGSDGSDGGGGGGGDGRTLVAGVAADVLVLTNNAYGGRLKGMSRAEVLGSDGVLPRWLKAANGL